MKLVLLGMVLCLCFVARAQDDGTELMRRAAHCLTEKKFLAPSKDREAVFGYFLDEKSYPGERVLYAVQYAKPSRTDGYVFTIFLEDRDGVQDFNIQNNARFRLSKGGDSEVSFTTHPLGGVWTQEHLSSAIKQIEKRPRVAISASDMHAIDSSTRCEAYTDVERR